jgi:hypothetical protein
MDAKNNISRSFLLTFSAGKKNEANQNRIIPPAKRKNVSAMGSINSGINVREMGLLIPKMMLAMNIARWAVIRGLSLFISQK